MGFPIYSADDAFKAVVRKTDLYYLPYCLYLIHFGAGVSQDKLFVMKAFRKLLPDRKSYAKMPVLAYVHAYCENRDGDLDLSENILGILTKQEFPPALATRGDLAFFRHDKEGAHRYYLHSANLGHFVAKSRHMRLFKKGPQFFLKVFLTLSVSIKFFAGTARGEKYIFLDFYGLQGHA